MNLEEYHAKNKFDPTDSLLFEDEKHMAAAQFLITQAISLSRSEDRGFPTIHACLRDAAIHCEKARQFHTLEYKKELRKVGDELLEKLEYEILEKL